MRLFITAARAVQMPVLLTDHAFYCSVRLFGACQPYHTRSILVMMLRRPTCLSNLVRVPTGSGSCHAALHTVGRRVLRAAVLWGCQIVGATVVPINIDVIRAEST